MSFKVDHWAQMILRDSFEISIAHNQVYNRFANRFVIIGLLIKSE